MLYSYFPDDVGGFGTWSSVVWFCLFFFCLSRLCFVLFRPSFCFVLPITSCFVSYCFVSSCFVLSLRCLASFYVFFLVGNVVSCFVLFGGEGGTNLISHIICLSFRKSTLVFNVNSVFLDVNVVTNVYIFIFFPVYDAM